MYRLITISIETMAAAVILIPILLIYRKIFSQNKTQIKTANIFFINILFALYLFAVYTVTGLPSITYIRFDLSINIIPIIPMIKDFPNSILNIILFIPLGIFLPLLWEKMNSLKIVFWHGFIMSLIIEILQIFTYRATDINDLITNTLGTVIGYFIVQRLIKKNLSITPSKNISEFYILSIIVLIIMFLVQPFISYILWEIIL